MSTPSISYKRHRFSPEIIAHAVWVYCRFNMCFREVEELWFCRKIFAVGRVGRIVLTKGL